MSPSADEWGNGNDWRVKEEKKPMSNLEDRQNAAYEDSERRDREAVADWNAQVKKGTVLKGTFFRVTETGPSVETHFDGPTTTEAYYDFPSAVVDVKGCKKIPLYELSAYFKTDAYRY